VLVRVGDAGPVSLCLYGVEAGTTAADGSPPPPTARRHGVGVVGLPRNTRTGMNGVQPCSVQPCIF
jgi:hypothetical protein